MESNSEVKLRPQPLKKKKKKKYKPEQLSFCTGICRSLEFKSAFYLFCTAVRGRTLIMQPLTKARLSKI